MRTQKIEGAREVENMGKQKAKKKAKKKVKKKKINKSLCSKIRRD